MKRSFLEISKRVDIDAGVVDESADDLYGRVHGSVVQGRPIALVAIIDVDGQLRNLFLEVVDEAQRIVL